MPQKSEPVLRTLVRRFWLLLVLWWVITLGSTSGLLWGAVLSALVTWLSWRLFPATGYRLRSWPLICFVGFFLSRSVVAGVDVARRVLLPRLPVNPGEITMNLSVPEGSPRWLLANTLSLMPGTLSVSLNGDSLLLHCLDMDQSVERDVSECERRIAAVFGLAEAQV